MRNDLLWVYPVLNCYLYVQSTWEKLRGIVYVDALYNLKLSIINLFILENQIGNSIKIKTDSYRIIKTPPADHVLHFKNKQQFQKFTGI